LATLSLSPDGQYIATAITDETANTRTVIAVPTSGGEPKILKVIKPISVGAVMWSPDSRYVIAGDGRELWRITLNGQETKFTNHPFPGSQIVLNPDGKTFAFVQTTTAEQTNPGGVWVLEHVLQ
jgi:dipeptidyl aminopeptidase/acylaminoacyl peptidase